MDKDLTGIVMAYQDEMVDRLIDFINIPSVSGDRENIERALCYILDLARELGFEAESLLGGKVGVIEVPQSLRSGNCDEEAGEKPVGTEETLGILAHIDVVPPGDPKKWLSPAFQAEVRDGAVWGRGALDDKGPVIASLYALRALLDLGKPLKKQVRIILGTQEETEWSDMAEYVKTYPLPDYGFTPDGEFPICNIEKGSMDILVTIPVNRVCCDEPADLEEELSDDPMRSHSDDPMGRYSDNRKEGYPDLRANESAGNRKESWVLKSIDGGEAVNIVPARCTAVLERNTLGKEARETIIVEGLGTAAHSCQPEQADNAILDLCCKLKELPLVDNNLKALANMLLEQCSDVFGRGLGIFSKSEYCNGEFVHRNAFAPTVIRTFRERVEIHFNVRFPYGAEIGKITGVFQIFATSLGGESQTVMLLPAVYVSREKPFLKAFAEAYESVSGRQNTFSLAYGGSYAKAMPNIVSWGPLFPEETDTCHCENEKIVVDHLMMNAKIFAEALRRITLSDQSFLEENV